MNNKLLIVRVYIQCLLFYRCRPISVLVYDENDF